MATLVPAQAAHAALKADYSRVLELALLLGLVLHLALIFLTPPHAIAPYRLPRADAFVGVEVTEPEPEIRVTEPPEEVAHPAVPVAWNPAAVPELAEKPALPEIDVGLEPGPAPLSGVGTGGPGTWVNERNPVVLKRVLPGYPPLAREAGAEGTVQVRVRVDAQGRVVDTRVEASDAVEALERAALEAAAGFLFQPARQQGMPVPFQTLLTFEFRLH